MSNTNNLVQGPAKLYWAPIGTDEPTDLSVPPPDPWIDLGIIKNGLSIESKTTYIELQRDKSLHVSDRKVVKVDTRISTHLAEQTLENYKITQNGGTITTDAGSRTFTPYTDGNEATGGMMIVDGLAPGGKRRRIIFRNVMQTGTAAFKYIYNMESFYRVLFSVHESKGEAPYIIIDATE